MAKTQEKTKTPAKTSEKPIEIANVKPPSLMERNQPKKPTTLRVCGNTVPVNKGVAAEADPRVLRQRRKEALQKRGEREGKTYREDETRI